MEIEKAKNLRPGGRVKKKCSQCGKIEWFSADDTGVGDKCRKENIRRRMRENLRLPYYLKHDDDALNPTDCYWVATRTAHKTSRRV